MLVVVEHRDLHALAQHFFDVETLRRLDILEIDPAERGLQRSDHLDQFHRIEFVHFDIEAVDAGEFLEQHRLAFHHRFRGERADGTQPEHRRAVGDDADEIATRGQVARLGRVAHDFLAGDCDPRGIGQRQVALIDQALGGGHRNLPRLGQAMVVEGGLAQLVWHDFPECETCYRRQEL